MTTMEIRVIKYTNLNAKKKSYTDFGVVQKPYLSLKKNRFSEFFNSCRVITSKLSNT